MAIALSRTSLTETLNSSPSSAIACAHLHDAREVELRREVERRDRTDRLAEPLARSSCGSCVSGMSWKSPSRGMTGALGAAAAAARGEPAAAAASMSRLMIRPSGPEPCTLREIEPALAERAGARAATSGRRRPAGAAPLRGAAARDAEPRADASAAVCCGGVLASPCDSAARRGIDETPAARLLRRGDLLAAAAAPGRAARGAAGAGDQRVDVLVRRGDDAERACRPARSRPR